jgi:hypothetical protein
MAELHVDDQSPQLPSIEQVMIDMDAWQRYHDELGQLLEQAERDKRHQKYALERASVGGNRESKVKRLKRAYTPEEWVEMSDDDDNSAVETNCVGCSRKHSDPEYRLRGTGYALCQRCHDKLCDSKHPGFDDRIVKHDRIARGRDQENDQDEDDDDDDDEQEEDEEDKDA